MGGALEITEAGSNSPQKKTPKRKAQKIKSAHLPKRPNACTSSPVEYRKSITAGRTAADIAVGRPDGRPVRQAEDSRMRWGGDRRRKRVRRQQMLRVCGVGGVDSGEEALNLRQLPHIPTTWQIRKQELFACPNQGKMGFPCRDWRA